MSNEPIDCPLKIAAASFGSLNAFDATSFRDLDRKADEFALFLKNLGVKEGGRIAILHPPCASFAALIFAVWRIGASICPLSLRLPESQIQKCLVRLGAHLFIHSLSPFRYTSLFSSFGPIPYPATLFFTSGSTGSPKIAVLSRENLLMNAYFAIQALDLREQDRWLLNLPLYHVSGFGILLRCVLAKACIVLDKSDQKITHVSAVPTQLYRATPVYKHLRSLLIGGAPIAFYPERLPCYLSYGLTEMASLVCSSFRPRHPIHFGYPLPQREIRFSAEGEICVKGHCLFEGYWEQGELIRPFDHEGWFGTGDLGYFSQHGLTVLGRKDWQFISGGENIQPEEIEKELLLLPEILEAAVIPIKDSEYGYRPAAFVKSIDPLFNRNRMRKALMEKLPTFKIPCSLTLLDEFPRKGLKIDRAALFQL